MADHWWFPLRVVPASDWREHRLQANQAKGYMAGNLLDFAYLTALGDIHHRILDNSGNLLGIWVTGEGKESLSLLKTTKQRLCEICYQLASSSCHPIHLTHALLTGKKVPRLP